MPIIGSPSGRTVADLIEITKRKLLGGLQEKRDKTAVVLNDDATDTDLQLTYNTTSQGITRGSILEVGRELLYVWDVNTATTPDTLTVERGYLGTSRGAHPSGSVIRENPAYTRQDIFDALLDELRALNGSGLFAHYVESLTHSESSMVYALGTPEVGTPVGIHHVDYDTNGLQDQVGKAKARLLTDLPSGTSETGYGVQLLEGGHEGQAMRAVIRSTFDDFTAEGNILGNTCGLPDFAEMVLVWGACAALKMPTESRRTQLESAHGTRDPEQVQAGGNAFVANQFKQNKRDALTEALHRQRIMFPMRSTS